MKDFHAIKVSVQIFCSFSKMESFCLIIELQEFFIYPESKFYIRYVFSKCIFINVFVFVNTYNFLPAKKK